jgi:hypothetical protein
MSGLNGQNALAVVEGENFSSIEIDDWAVEYINASKS